MWVCQVDADFVQEMGMLRVLAGECQKLHSSESRLDSKGKKLCGEKIEFGGDWRGGLLTQPKNTYIFVFLTTEKARPK